ncbi:MAG: Nif3-like dinuclear metal center hexameric protein [Oscillospiraceae bacterium]|jgi:dinuclear metal center YbgI/SA1388 family protein|nr:Nif3-like dinuclear metal center hexameric protein [Oscillospiraceae bacterium]
MTVGEFYEAVKAFAPPELAAEGDRCGLLVGRKDRPCAAVLCALDITDAVLDEAEGLGAQVILAHHPLFWQLTEITQSSREGHTALRLCESGIAAICMHTNLDKARGGVNDSLAAFFLAEPYEVIGGGFCRAGRVARPMPMPAFAAEAKQKLGSGAVRYHDSGRQVRYLAVGSGNCASELPYVLETGCDTFLTGDIKHSVFLDAAYHGINLIDCGHYATEVVVFERLAPALGAICGDVRLHISKAQAEPYLCR